MRMPLSRVGVLLTPWNDGVLTPEITSDWEMNTTKRRREFIERARITPLHQTAVSDEDVAHNIIHMNGRQTRINRPLSHPPNEGSQMDEKIIQLELRVHGGVVHFFNSL